MRNWKLYFISKWIINAKNDPKKTFKCLKICFSICRDKIDKWQKWIINSKTMEIRRLRGWKMIFYLSTKSRQMTKVDKKRKNYRYKTFKRLKMCFSICREKVDKWQKWIINANTIGIRRLSGWNFSFSFVGQKSTNDKSG